MAIAIVTNVPPEEESDFDFLKEGLEAAGYEVTLTNLENSLEALTALTPDTFIFNCVEEFNGMASNESGIAGYLELAHIPFTGSGAKTLAMLQDKGVTKAILDAVGCKVARAVIVKPGNAIPDMSYLAWPRMVKYASEDASEGITAANVTNNEDELIAQIERLEQAKPNAPIFVEEYIEGREILAAVIGNGDERRVLPPIEVTFEGNAKIVTQDAKQKEDSEDFNNVVSDAAELTPEEAQAIEEAVLLACRAVEINDYARVDIRLKGNVPWIIEINPNPDLTPDHGVGGSAKLAGVSFPDLLNFIIESAKARYTQGE